MTFLMHLFSPPQVKETGEVAIAGGYVDVVPALDKPSAWEAMKVGGSRRSLNFQSSIVRLYSCEKCRKNT